eukprot:TRINITY_DN2746_c0_g1_i5.p1 TRINITY_DN2746_c0_g1~~TRINITY_DN2746_c0_g1_i5.p1  ORF type:complete len:510 (+),score=171.19 TRINITY_DN2746_c0_g1_i5:57-1586(+)
MRTLQAALLLGAAACCSAQCTVYTAPSGTISYDGDEDGVRVDACWEIQCSEQVTLTWDRQPDLSNTTYLFLNDDSADAVAMPAQYTGSLTVEYVSENGTGFAMNWTCAAPVTDELDACETLSAVGGSLDYPGNSTDYAACEDRCWTIPCDSHLFLQWSALDIEAGSDFLYLDGTKYDGVAAADLPTSFSGSLTLRFTSDTTGTAKGFKVSWACATPPPMYELGCFRTDKTRFGMHFLYASDWNTPEYCATRCAAGGYMYAGMEFGTQCWCGAGTTGSVKTLSAACDIECSGDSGAVCGGAWKMNLYSLTSPVTQPAPVAVGCFDVDPAARAVGALAYSSDANTVEECVSVCGWNGFKYAGLEFGKQCWCGNSLPVDRTVGRRCNVECPGNTTESCGGGFRQSVYVADGSGYTPYTRTYKGCYVDHAGSRALSVMAFQDVGCTVEECTEACGHRGFSYAGLQYREQCWCGNSITTAKVAEYQCRMPCRGDSSEICGYAYRDSVYEVTATA